MVYDSEYYQTMGGVTLHFPGLARPPTHHLKTFYNNLFSRRGEIPTKGSVPVPDRSDSSSYYNLTDQF